jgi:hypothetical protein
MADRPPCRFRAADPSPSGASEDCRFLRGGEGIRLGSPRLRGDRRGFTAGNRDRTRKGGGPVTSARIEAIVAIGGLPPGQPLPGAGVAPGQRDPVPRSRPRRETKPLSQSGDCLRASRFQAPGSAPDCDTARNEAIAIDASRSAIVDFSNNSRRTNGAPTAHRRRTAPIPDAHPLAPRAIDRGRRRQGRPRPRRFDPRPGSGRRPSAAHRAERSHFDRRKLRFCRRFRRSRRALGRRTEPIPFADPSPPRAIDRAPSTVPSWPGGDGRAGQPTWTTRWLIDFRRPWGDL